MDALLFNKPVLALLDNLFFVAKLDAAARQSGLRLKTARTFEKAISQLETELPALIVLDLDAQACRPFEFIQVVKTKAQMQSVPLLGFVSHVNTGVQQQARAAGCDRIMARSAFFRDLPALLQTAATPDLPTET